MTTQLPQMMNYQQVHSQLPDNMVATQVVLSAINSSSFGPGSIAQFDLLSRGFAIPDSFHIRYKYQATNTNGAEMLGTPCYTPFSRLETIFGSNVAETINDYNVVANMLVNLTTSVSSRFGLQAMYGYGSTATAPSMNAMDGRTLTAGEAGSFSALLPGLLSNSEKLWPLFAMPSCRVQLTLDSLNNMFNTNTIAPVPAGYATNFVITNFELVYTMLDGGPAVESMIRSLGRFYIKSQSLSNSSVVLQSGTAGSISLIYNNRLSSVKSAFILFAGTGAGAINKKFDSFDPTGTAVGVGSTELSLNIGGISYPQRALSTGANRSGVLMALRNAIGSIYDKTNDLAINNVEWNYASSLTVPTTVAEPSKFIFGLDLEKIHGEVLLSGISTENSAIAVNVNLGTATVQSFNVSLILSYDALVEVDTESRQVSVKQ